MNQSSNNSSVPPFGSSNTLSSVNRAPSNSSSSSKASSRFESIFGAVRRVKRSNSNSSGKENLQGTFLLNKRKGSSDNSASQAFSTSDSVPSSTLAKKKEAPLFPLRGAKSTIIPTSSDYDSQGVPHPDDRIQTSFKVEPIDFDESDEMMMDSRKPFQAPPNPPPPIPHHKQNGSPTHEFAAPLPPVNGSSNGFKAPVSQVKKPPSISTSVISNGSSAKFSASKEHGAAVTDRNVPVMKLNGFVGFDSLPYQLVHKCQKQGFQFNLLCVGETGMGKTTLIESLFNMKLEFEPCNNELKTVELRTKTCEITEGGVNVKLRIVETAGFGDQLDKDKSARIIVDYINEQFESYLKEELKICRQLARYDDTRIHACLYFISPTGHGLKALDVVTIRELAKRVNVIPVIAKSDTTCKDELARFKKKILSELKSNNIEIYQFPIDDETVRNENQALNSLMPFAVVGSTDFVTKEDGRLVRARRYPWGMVEVENVEHCDFVKLREALLRINVDSLRTRTHKILYETYRRERLREMKMKDGDCGPKMMEAFEQKQREFQEEMKRKDEEFQKQFINRVNAKEEEFKRRDELLALKKEEQQKKFEEELLRLESSMNSLREEKARLEGRLTSKKNKQRL